MSRQHHRRHRSKIRSLYVWHRYIGVTAALLVVILATTGLMLNHSEDFAWDSTYVSSPWLLDWYGIEPPEQARGYPLGDDTLSLYGRQLYFNDHRLAGEYRQLQGALATPDMIIAAADQSLLLLTRKGGLIERLDAQAGLPGMVQRLGRDAQGQPLVMIHDQPYRPDADWLRWQVWEGKAADIHWTREAPVSAVLQERLTASFRSHILPLERVLLDLHSGRIFGRHGHWVMDIAAGLLLVLAGSGFWMWFRRRR